MASRGPITDEALDAALQRVSYMFPSTVGTFQTNTAASFQRTPSATNGRNRVDSQARPQEFVQHLRNRDDRNKFKFRDFGFYGVKEPILRQRVESKAIDENVLNRAVEDFRRHDKLSVEDLSKLHDLADQAFKLHKDHDDVNAEHIFEEANHFPPRPSTAPT